MDPRFRELPHTTNALKFDDDENFLSSYEQPQNLINGIKPEFSDLDVRDIPFLPLTPSLDNFFPSPTLTPDANSPDDHDSDPVLKYLNQILVDGSTEEKLSMSYGAESPDDHDSDPVLTYLNQILIEESIEEKPSISYGAESPDDHDSDPVLRYLNQILIEESIEDKPSMFHDPLALRAAEKSLYEAIGERYPPSPYNHINYGDQTTDSPDSFFGSSSEYTNSSNAGSIMDPQWIVDPGLDNSSGEQGSVQDTSSNSVVQISSQLSSDIANDFNNNFNFQMSSLESANMIQSIFSDSESILQFKRGMEEASKFLPTSNQLVIDLDKYLLPQKSEDTAPAVAVKVEKDEIDHFPNGLKGRKHQHSEDSDSEDVGRNSKQSAIYDEDAELSEMFDRVLLCPDAKGGPIHRNIDNNLPSVVNKTLLQNVRPNMTNGGKTRGKKNENQRDTVDLRSLLINCSQSVAAGDRRTAHEQLRQIRHHSSPTGDAYQRLANVFTTGLEARLAGTGTELYASLTQRKITATEKLKAYQVYLSACPFKKSSMSFANMMIYLAASEKAALHIVDFGILYGFQWPILIQYLSQRPGGPPKLRITGIELPQPGFRPAERIEETGRRLQKYCERFDVPFEYQAIATQNWETIKIKDLNVRSGEFLAVNCLFRFGKLLDETVVIDSPRDAVLKLIRRMKPDIFVNAILNGSYTSPFFVTRFREALFHYSALFDMFDATLPRDNPQRMDFEQDFYGREVINVIACEGAERVERPETYKQWQVRHMRAGFKPLRLNQEIVKKLRHKMTEKYHKDFLYDEDGNWMLQGWKGRIICASSCWVPA